MVNPTLSGLHPNKPSRPFDKLSFNLLNYSPYEAEKINTFNCTSPSNLPNLLCPAPKRNTPRGLARLTHERTPNTLYHLNILSLLRCLASSLLYKRRIISLAMSQGGTYNTYRTQCLTKINYTGCMLYFTVRAKYLSRLALNYPKG